MALIWMCEAFSQERCEKQVSTYVLIITEVLKRDASGAINAQLSDGDVTVDAVLYATGRRPNIRTRFRKYRGR